MRDERERECNRHLNDILTYLSEFIVASCLRIIPHLFTISLGLVLFFSFFASFINEQRQRLDDTHSGIIECDKFYLFRNIDVYSL